MELVENFSNSLQYLRIAVFSSGIRLRDLKTIPAKTEKKAVEFGSQVKNLKELDVEMTDLIFGDDPIVTPFVWRRFFKAMRTSLEKLKMQFRKNKAWELYNDFELLEKNSLTNLKCLSVWWSDCILHFDITKLTKISNQLEILELVGTCGKFNIGADNLDWIPLSLKKLVFPVFPFSDRSGMNNWTFLKAVISARDSLVVQYDGTIDIKMAESLGVFLTKPNFVWTQIDYNNLKEKTVALGLCEKFGIPTEKLHNIGWRTRW